MKSVDIRKKFIEFFVSRGHTAVPSSGLIPAQDPTLLFANAGMNQFKDLFLGKEKRSYTRATSIQKCIRAGGKHNDLENVGFTKRHLTFFEMMGNFSFGDYFKEDAIQYAWDFLTKEVGLDAAKLHASVYKHDDEAYSIWKTQIGLPEAKIVRLGESDNFWQMGDTGPCGPCTEIYIDRGQEQGCGQEGCAPGCSCDRFLEVWNLVFMQFDRQPDGTDKPLAAKGVDTGMGLERLCAIAQHKDSVFETDIFEPLLKKIEELTGKKYAQADQETQGAFRVLADHIRSASFAIADGCSPSNEGRGYVLRKIIRRAALFAQKLSSDNFFPQIADALVASMGPIYPELVAQKQLIMKVLTSEIEKFSANLVSGQGVLEDYFKAQASSKEIAGSQAFKLYDTYGFPLELTQVIAQQRGFTVDRAGFEHEMEAQRLQSGKKQAGVALTTDLVSIFTGYDELESEGTISGILPGEGKRSLLITPRSPFYVECGGQVSDRGFVQINGSMVPVLGVKKIDGAIALEVELPMLVKVGDKVRLIVDRDARLATMKNHTATHLLQSALLTVVGKSIKQSGSLVNPDYLRFDFTHYENLTAEQIAAVEDLVNAKIMENIPLRVQESTLAAAQKEGVIAFFGEKYNPEKVRVVAVPGFSAELCGGTHVRATGDIGSFKITEVSSLSAGNRRLVAVTGPQAIKLFQRDFNLVKELCQEYKTVPAQLSGTLLKSREALKESQGTVEKLKRQLYTQAVPQWLAAAETVAGITFGYISIDGATAQDLRDIASDLQARKAGLYFLYSAAHDRVQFVLALSRDLVSKVNLKALAEELKASGLKGGVSDTLVQGGGSAVPADLKEKIKQFLVK